jgi:hypothetical protein
MSHPHSVNATAPHGPPRWQPGQHHSTDLTDPGLHRAPLRVGEPACQPSGGRGAQPGHRREHLPGHIGALAIRTRPRNRRTSRTLPTACHTVERYANNPVEADHGRLKARQRPMRGLKRLCLARVISTGHAFVQNLRRGHYELGVDVEPRHWLTAIFSELTHAI